jgi:hypothetical protein
MLHEFVSIRVGNVETIDLVLIHRRVGPETPKP